jgi:hypothetical protein
MWELLPISRHCKQLNTCGRQLTQRARAIYIMWELYHVGAPANLTALQAIEHLWEATHTTGANGGALVLVLNHLTH